MYFPRTTLSFFNVWYNMRDNILKSHPFSEDVLTFIYYRVIDSNFNNNKYLHIMQIKGMSVNIQL